MFVHVCFCMYSYYVLLSCFGPTNRFKISIYDLQCPFPLLNEHTLCINIKIPSSSLMLLRILHKCKIPSNIILSDDHLQAFFCQSLASALLAFSNLIFSLGALTHLCYHRVLCHRWYQVFICVCGHFLCQMCLMLISLVEITTSFRL